MRVLNLDDLNPNGDPQPDGVFDFVDGLTINRQTGRIIFPVLEPFGSSLRAKFCGDSLLADYYCYDPLYDSTKVAAQQIPEKNKFSLRGTYQSSSGSDIPLNAINIPQGSVKVTAGGVPLRENVDYQWTYALGRVKIINDGLLKSNTPIRVSLESQSLFNLQQKTYIGNRFDYTFNKDLPVGATVLHLNERPLTQKVNIYDEPISNTVVGVDNTVADSRFLTRLLDKLPFYNTKETSTLTFSGEVAKLFPGHNKAMGQKTVSPISTTSKAPSLRLTCGFPATGTSPALRRGKCDRECSGSAIQQQPRLRLQPREGRLVLCRPAVPARPARYYACRHRRRRPEQQLCTGDSAARDLPERFAAYRSAGHHLHELSLLPTERGPYNYDVDSVPGLSAGIDTDGRLRDPASRWGGIMRRLETTDFEASNIEFIQFWMMDPFATGTENDRSGR